MSGFLGLFDYSKPGPGVPKDAPPKPPVLLFFELYFRKFWNLIKINLLFFFFNIPALIAAMFVSEIIFAGRTTSDAFGDFILKLVIALVLVCVPVITVGPAQAGFTYILRNYSRQEHAFIWGDFKDHARKNLKQSLIICGIDFIVMIVTGLDFYILGVAKSGNFVLSFATGAVFVVFVFYLMMHIYIYPMLVTFELTIKQIYKNALIFAMLKFIPNLIILVVSVGLVAVLFLTLPLLSILLFPFLILSTVGFITNFYAYSVLKKYMLDRIQNNEQSVEQQ